MVAVEYTTREARALLALIEPDMPLTTEDLEVAQIGKEKLRRAFLIEAQQEQIDGIPAWLRRPYSERGV